MRVKSRVRAYKCSCAVVILLGSTTAIADIHGSGIADIHGSGINDIHGSGIADIHGSGATRLVLSAPVDFVDIDNGILVSLGQSVMASGDVLTSLKAGDFVDVYGSVVAPGMLYADEVVISSTPYVAGADTLFVTGIAANVDFAFGTATLGDLDIDISQVGYSVASSLSSSGIWTAVGIQTQKGGRLYADVLTTQ